MSASTRMKLDPNLTPYIKSNSKWIKHPIVKTYSVKFLEENIGMCLGLGNGFLNLTIHISNKWHVYRLYKELLQHHNIKWGDNIHRKFKEEKMQFPKT